MPEFKVVMTARVLSRRDIEFYQTSLGVDFQSIPCNTEDEIIAAARDADAVITLMQPYSRRVIQGLEKCKLIFNGGTGFDTIDVQAATEKDICVANPGEYCTEEVAEHAIALLLDCARKITRLDRAVREGKWIAFEKREIRGQILPPIFQWKGQTLGLIGLGRIGRAIVPMAKGIGLSVIAFDRTCPRTIFDEVGVAPVTLEYLLEKSDFVIIAASFSAEAKHLMGTEQFRKMKPTAYLINIARGSFVDEKALYTALSEGYIAGAALDVVDAEPECMPPDHPLLTLDNVIVTAHSAYYSEQSAATYKQRIYEAVANVVNGKYPDWLINPEVKENFQKRWLHFQT